MKFIHLSDLHIGKRLNERSFLEDQEHILRQITDAVKSEKADAIIIAGDIYDKGIPSAEAVNLLDDFLFELSQTGAQIFIISGNHDSADRLAFGGRLFKKSGIHVSPVYDGTVEPVTMTDEFGEVNIYLLPFIKPVTVRNKFPDTEIETYTDAVKAAVNEMAPDTKLRNIIVTHQFVTGAQRSGSEEISVGGTDNVDVSVFDSFDYVALGHIHGTQTIDRETVRYCGTPLKYSFAEKNHTKTLTVAEMKEKGNIQIKTLPLSPLHDLREIRGSFAEITEKALADEKRDDYIKVVLTDEIMISSGMDKLRRYYPNILELSYDNETTRRNCFIGGAETAEIKSPQQLFEEFFFNQNGRELSDRQKEFSTAIFEKLTEGRK